MMSVRAGNEIGKTVDGNSRLGCWLDIIVADAAGRKRVPIHTIQKVRGGGGKGQASGVQSCLLELA